MSEGEDLVEAGVLVALEVVVLLVSAVGWAEGHVLLSGNGVHEHVGVVDGLAVLDLADNVH